jgi:hypothetical protein
VKLFEFDSCTIWSTQFWSNHQPHMHGYISKFFYQWL